MKTVHQFIQPFIWSTFNAVAVTTLAYVCMYSTYMLENERNQFLCNCVGEQFACVSAGACLQPSLCAFHVLLHKSVRHLSISLPFLPPSILPLVLQGYSQSTETAGFSRSTRSRQINDLSQLRPKIYLIRKTAIQEERKIIENPTVWDYLLSLSLISLLLFFLFPLVLFSLMHCCPHPESGHLFWG